MNEEFVPLGKQSPADISQKLAEIGDEEAAAEYDAHLVASQGGVGVS